MGKGCKKLTNIPKCFTSHVPGCANSRVAILTRNVVTYPVPEYCAKDIMVIQAKLGNKTTYMVLLYCDQTIYGYPKELIALLKDKKKMMTS